MKIKQGYASYSMQAFKFIEKHQLEPYHDLYDDVVVIGVYNELDLGLIMKHKGRVVIQWEGLDSKRYGKLEMFKAPNIIHVSPHYRVCDYFKSLGIICHEIRWITTGGPTPQIRGNKVYAYLNKHNPTYYGSNVIAGLRHDYNYAIADFTIKQEEWHNGAKYKYYSQAFVSLALSPFVGGGFSIVELGLCGVRVVTNILRMPHTIAWEKPADIEKIIEGEAQYIGTSDPKLAQAVYSKMIDLSINPGYDLEKLII